MILKHTSNILMHQLLSILQMHRELVFDLDLDIQTQLGNSCMWQLLLVSIFPMYMGQDSLLDHCNYVLKDK
jgi:hypothetical protein